jgi:hypothetical protein
VGEAPDLEAFARGQDSYEPQRPAPVGAHSVGKPDPKAPGDPKAPPSTSLGDRAPTKPQHPATVGAHSVGEAPDLKAFALGTGLLRNRNTPPP